ncbi:MAG: 5-guanidino-2-oxopentanoate decarboxylase [Thermomicrobiales bacterium]|nr:5-guanidino-2-oxopentanoate decarboxylase [Thermomicrobiales bacterium]
MGETSVLTGGEAVVRSLERHGVRHVFGIPGDHTIPIYAALGKSRIAHCATRHEQGAGFMADGYARASGNPGVAIVIGGPGLTNIATALAEATADGAPVLVISADTPLADRRMGRDHNHELRDQQAAAAALCRWSARIDSVAQIPGEIARAFAAFQDEQRGSVHIGVPVDLLSAASLVDLGASPGSPPPGPATEGIERAANLLRDAERPLVLLGGGARFASGSAVSLAEALDAPVMTSWSGMDAFPGEHPLWVGGGFHLAAAREALTGADVVLAVGTQFGRSDFWSVPAAIPGQVIRVDLDPGQIDTNIGSTVGIVGDAKTVIESVIAVLPRRARTDGVARAAWMRAAIDAEADRAGAAYRPWLAAMRRGLPDDAVIAADSTLATYLGFRYLRIPSGGAFLYPNAYGTLGYALPAAIGARVAQPNRPAAVLIGDGGFLFTCPELLTGVEQGLGLPVVVWNDRGYGCIRAGMREQGVMPLGVDFAIPNLAALASGFGVGYARADDPQTLEGAVREAIGREAPTVIEVDATGLHTVADTTNRPT